LARGGTLCLLPLATPLLLSEGSFKAFISYLNQMTERRKPCGWYVTKNGYEVDSKPHFIFYSSDLFYSHQSSGRLTVLHVFLRMCSCRLLGLLGFSPRVLVG